MFMWKWTPICIIPFVIAVVVVVLDVEIMHKTLVSLTTPRIWNLI